MKRDHRTDVILALELAQNANTRISNCDSQTVNSRSVTQLRNRIVQAVDLRSGLLCAIA